MSSPQDASIAEYGGVVRIDADRGLVVCERALLVTLAVPCVAAVVVRRCLARIEPNGRIEVGDRPVEVAPTESELSTREVECRILRSGRTLGIVAVGGNNLILLGDSPVFLGDSPIILGDSLVLLGDSILLGDSLLLGDSPILLGDSCILLGDSIILGDSRTLLAGSTTILGDRHDSLRRHPLLRTQRH